MLAGLRRCAPRCRSQIFRMSGKMPARGRVPLLIRLGYRSALFVPRLREQQIMDALTVWGRQSGEFKPEVVNLLQTFATQSVLAFQTPGCSTRSRKRVSRSKRPTGISRNFSATCHTSCAPRSTLSAASPKCRRKNSLVSRTRNKSSSPTTFSPPAAVCSR